jgi:hypothetical protein
VDVVGQCRIGQGGCDWLGVQEGYLLLGLDWACCADLADEGADVASFGPLVISFIKSHEVLNGPNITDRDAGRTESQPERERTKRAVPGHTHPSIPSHFDSSHAHSINSTSANMHKEHNKEFIRLTFYFSNNHTVQHFQEF